MSMDALPLFPLIRQLLVVKLSPIGGEVRFRLADACSVSNNL